MGESYGVIRRLVAHFFRRFFDNDTLQVDGDTQTTVVRAASIVAMPGMMFAFLLINQYPKRSLWGSIEDQYFFVLFSFVVMGAVSIFEWEMLFPDRLDFLILSPLPVKPKQMLAAKGIALVGFLALFLVACNAFGAVMLPGVTFGHFWRQVLAHVVAVGMAGMFSALMVLALGGVLLCVFDPARFRLAAPAMQTVGVAVLTLLLVHYAMNGDGMQAWLTEPLGKARFVPPLWFLGVYERIFRGAGAPPFAREMARYAVWGTVTAAAVVAVTYPIAWARVRRMAMEGATRKRAEPSRLRARVVQSLVRRPEERAVFHFIGQTMTRSSRYQVYLAMYGGAGLALAVACAVTFRVYGGSEQAGVSTRGLHAMMPLLLFWVIAGLRTAFAFPMNLSARWVFRMPGVTMRACTTAARRWVLVCALGVLVCILVVLRMAKWDWQQLLVQATCGLCLCVLLVDGFFFWLKGVPLNQPRLPGRTSLPLVLTLYFGVFPLFVTQMVRMELGIEKHLWKLLVVAGAAMLIHLGVRAMGDGPEEVEEEMVGYEGEIQVLGLS